MSLSVNSPSMTRLKALAKLVDSGDTVEYAAAMYSVPYTIACDYLAGLSGRIHSNTVENNKQVHGVSATKGHLTVQGGIRGHSAGDIFPYIIVLKGNFIDGFKYYIMGNGSHWEYDDYDHAYKEALGWLEFDSLDTFLANR